MDLAYIRTRSTHLDLKLIVKTIPAVLSGKGAS
jgi:lipopolysaccharide/colanic/teichoic acid biosynthesis glycosyltransferase